MSFADVVIGQIKTFSDGDLIKIKHSVEDEQHARITKKFKDIHEDAIEKFLRVWPNLEKDSGKIKITTFDDDRIYFQLTPNVKLEKTRYEKEPPFGIRLEKSSDHYSLAIDLNCQNKCTSYPTNWFNFGGKTGGTMGKHWQFPNMGELPKEILSIPIIADLMNNYTEIMKRLNEK